MRLRSIMALIVALGVSSAARAQAPTQVPAQVPALTQSQATAPPKLVVTIVVDQYSANLFNQYRSRYRFGLRRLIDQGLVYANGYQAHGFTETCPGHSTVLSGMHPSHTGIPANNWVDPATGANVYCLGDARTSLAHGKVTDNGTVSAANFKVDFVPDWLKAVSPDSRIFAVSGKDRGAVSLAGHAGAPFWFTDGFGLTTYVEPGQSADERLEPVAAFNARFRASRPRPWTGKYADCQALASDWTLFGKAFQSRVPPANPQFDVSPALDEETLRAAIHLIDGQKLGQRGATDMLGVSLSATDLIGHAFGTQGPEMCEQEHRLDEALGMFLDKLAGLKGGALVVLTADHGGSDFAEREAARGYPARRIGEAGLDRVNAALKAQFNLADAPLRVGAGAGTLIVSDAKRRALPEPLRTEVAEAAVALLRLNPDYAYVETRERLLAMPEPDATLPEMMSLADRFRLSTVAGRTADILFTYPFAAMGGGGRVAGHGTPWDYDRRVPIVFWWPGAQGQERFLPVRTVDIAPTLANVMGLKTAPLDGRCLDLGLKAC